jgi:hypothetical protein
MEQKFVKFREIFILEESDATKPTSKTKDARSYNLVCGFGK